MKKTANQLAREDIQKRIKRAQNVTTEYSLLPTSEQVEQNDTLEEAMISVFSDGTKSYWFEDSVLYEYQDGRMEALQSGSDQTPYRGLIVGGQFGDQREMSDQDAQDWVQKTNQMWSKIDTGRVGPIQNRTAQTVQVKGLYLHPNEFNWAAEFTDGTIFMSEHDSTDREYIREVAGSKLDRAHGAALLAYEPWNAGFAAMPTNIVAQFTADGIDTGR